MTGDKRFGGRRVSVAMLLAATGSAVVMAAPAFAQSAAQPEFSIPAAPLADAIVLFGRQSGLQVTADAGLMDGRQASAVSGPRAPAEALGQLLTGTGLTYRFVGHNAVRLERAPQASGNAVQLGPVRVEAADEDGSAGNSDSSGGDPTEATYRTAGAVTHVSRETIDRFRGSSPADVFRGIPGVMSGEARNGAGSIDVNIRGMQGMGRVATTIDGAENEMMVYQGYQGLSNRTFVDPDLISGIDITRGSDASSHGIAGTVAMHTFNAEDILKPGQTFGVRLNLGFGGNTATPHAGDLGGYTWPMPYVSDPQPYPVPTASASGLVRPSFLDPTSGSASIVAAARRGAFDLVLGYAHRKQGNYFAGSNGPGAEVIDTGPQPLCYSSGFCYYPPSPISYAHVYKNGGLTSYRTGEQILNTQLETDSWIAKGTFRFGDGHALQLGYSGYRSEAGDILAANFQSPTTQAQQKNLTAGTRVDTGTMRYHWKPADNPLFDLKANLWLTSLRLFNPPRLGGAFVGTLPEDLGLPLDYRTENVSRMWGGDVSNTSKIPIGDGSLRLDYGASYVDEDTHPTQYTDELNDIASRDGSHQELGAYLKAAYTPASWLTLNGGLRYSHYWSHDRAGPDAYWPDDPLMTNDTPRRSAGGWSPSAGITVEPIKDLQLYVNYSNAVRMPTLFESVKAYTVLINENLRPERSRNWEVGANLVRNGVFADGDKAMLKLGYFNWDVKDFVAREYTTFNDEYLNLKITGLQIYNIARARFAGIEFSGQYDIGGFSAQLAANYYTKVEFCQTADTCADKTLSADYATNQVPPRYSVNVTLAQKLFDEKLTVGGRASFIGKRAAGHGQPVNGLLTLIAVVNWKPYAEADLFADYKLTRNLTLWTRVENVLDKYYVDPLSLVDYPAPGRTFRFGLTGNFGGPRESSKDADSVGAFDGNPFDWSGLHLDAFSDYDFARFRGRMTTLDGSDTGYPSLEKPRQTLSGFAFGVGGGYDAHLTDRVTAGFEADIARPQIAGSQITYATEGAACYSCTAGDSNLLRARSYESVLTSKVDWLSTVRGRLGYAASDKLMVFATGGLGILRQDAARTQYALAKATDTMTKPSFTERQSVTRTGLVLGGGAEYAFDRHWSLKGEALFSWFGNKQMAFSNARAGVMPDTTTGGIYNPSLPGCDFATNVQGCFTPVVPVTGSANQVVGRQMTSKLEVPIIRIGVSYHF